MLGGNVAGADDPGSPTQEVKDWFVQHGVPHFLPTYSVKDRAGALVVPLLMLLAVQLGAGTWSAVGVGELLVAPPATVILAILLQRAFQGRLGLSRERPRRWWLLLVWMLVWLLAPVAVPYLFALAARRFVWEESKWYWPDPWVDAAVLFTVLLTCTLLFRSQA
jgi:hypothetical protein